MTLLIYTYQVQNNMPFRVSTCSYKTWEVACKISFS